MRVFRSIVLLAVPFVVFAILPYQLFHGVPDGVGTAQAESVSPRKQRGKRRLRRAVRSFSLMNADTNKPIRGYNPIKNDTVIDLRDLPTSNLNIRANVRSRRVRSVAFIFDDGPDFTIDEAKPFSAFGDNRGDYFSWNPVLGAHKISAVPLRRNRTRRRASTPREINIVVSESTGGEELAPPPPIPTPPSPPTEFPPIPNITQWEFRMLEWGGRHCDRNTILDLTTWEGNVWYYDGMRVYYQMSDYWGDSVWDTCAGFVSEVYEPYVLGGNGSVPGWRVFAEGLGLKRLRTGSTAAGNAAVLLSQNSAFAALGGGPEQELSRETALLINAYLTAEVLGEPRNPLLATAVDYALGHIDQWAISQTANFVQPFMVGLTSEALIRYYETTGDTRIPAAIQTAADFIWDMTWDNSAGAFRYMLCKPGFSNPDCGLGPIADLNLLIAPAFAWLYLHTGDTRYLERGDAIFASGVTNAWLGNGKQFSQNYRWSFDFVEWRRGG